jgi:hypothetical protein
VLDAIEELRRQRPTSGTRKATVAVARKLAVILHRMLRDGTEFRWSAKRAQPA